MIESLWHFRKQFKTNQIILVRADDEEAESVLIGKTSADLFLEDEMRWVCVFARDCRMRFRVKRVPTKVNEMPDALD